MPQRYNTGNSRPSNSIKDLNDNALAFDDYMNTESDIYIDRFGNAKDSLSGTAIKITAAAGVAVEATRQNLIPLSKQYMTLAAAQADIANIPEGSATYVRSADGSSLADEYINNGGTLVATGRKMPSQSAVDGARQHADAVTESSLLPVNEVNAAQIDNAANTVKHIFSVLQQTISAAVSSALFPQRSAFIISSMSNDNINGQPGGLTAKVSGVVTYQNTILPGESVAAGVKTTPYAWRDLTGLAPASITYDASVVRVRYAVTLAGQTVSPDKYNVQDKTGRFAPTTQQAAGSVTVTSVSSHTAGGIQLAVPNSVITGAGFTVNDAGVNAWLADLWPLSFYCLTSTTQGTEFVDFAVIEPGQFSLDVSAGITFSGGIYSSRIPPVESVVGDLSHRASISGYERQVFSGDLAAASGFIVDDSAVLFIAGTSTSSIPENVNGLVISKDGAEFARRYLPWSATLADNIFSSMHRPFRVRDLTLNSLASAAPGMVRIGYFLPDGFGGLKLNYSVPVVTDMTGIFYPTPANSITSSTQRAVSGHANDNMVQFVLPAAEMTAAGYDVTDKFAVDRYLRGLAADCQFLAYTGVNRTFSLDDSVLAVSLPAGTYTFSYLTEAGLRGVIRKPQPARQVDTGAYTRVVADVKNATSWAFSNVPVEIRASFEPGQVPTSSCLVVLDSDGNEYPCQWADEFHCNNRQQSNMGYHTDGSLRSGSVFLMDSIAVGAKKYYELKAYNRTVRNRPGPALIRNGRDFSVNVDGWMYSFAGSNQYQLTSVKDPAGVTHAISTKMYMAILVGGVFGQIGFGYKPNLQLVTTGPVFTEIQTTLFNSASADIPAGVLRADIRTRIFKNGKCQIYTQVMAVSEISVGKLFGVFNKLTLGDAAYSYDNDLFTAINTDSLGKIWTATMVRANGDTHRDGLAYGPDRPVFAGFSLPTTSTTAANAGWAYIKVDDYSFLNWPIKKGWLWTSEFWIDANDTITNKRGVVSKIQNRLVGRFGHCSFPTVVRRNILDDIANHVAGSMKWWNSPAATPYGGGTYGDSGTTVYTSMYHSYTADIMSLIVFGKGGFDEIYSNFKLYVLKVFFHPITNLGNAYLAGKMVLQFASRLTIPCLQWMYILAVRNNDIAKITELQSAIKNLADALVGKFNSLDGKGVPLNGANSDIGNSNSLAVSMRAIAIGVFSRQDESGSYLTAYNSMEALLTGSVGGYMRVEGIPTDGNGGSYSRLAQSMYLHYQVYVSNNYLFAEKLLGRTPVFDLVTFTLLATGGLGGFREIDYCMSESRRGSANTITFALFGLLLDESASATNAAAALLDKFKSQYGPKPGFPVRFFGFDGTTSAGNVVSDISYVGTTLADILLYFYFNEY